MSSSMNSALRALLDRYLAEDIGVFQGFSRIEPNTVGAEQVTPLHVACIRAAIDDVVILLEAGADVNAKMDMGQTPLHCAAYRRSAEIVRLLMEFGANPLAKSEFEESPIDVANKLGLNEVAAFLKRSVERKRER